MPARRRAPITLQRKNKGSHGCGVTKQTHPLFRININTSIVSFSIFVLSCSSRLETANSRHKRRARNGRFNGEAHMRTERILPPEAILRTNLYKTPKWRANLKSSPRLPKWTNVQFSYDMVWHLAAKVLFFQVKLLLGCLRCPWWRTLKRLAAKPT